MGNRFVYVNFIVHLFCPSIPIRILFGTLGLIPLNKAIDLGRK